MYGMVCWGAACVCARWFEIGRQQSLCGARGEMWEGRKRRMSRRQGGSKGFRATLRSGSETNQTRQTTKNWARVGLGHADSCAGIKFNREQLQCILESRALSSCSRAAKHTRTRTLYRIEQDQGNPGQPQSGVRCGALRGRMAGRSRLSTRRLQFSRRRPVLSKVAPPIRKSSSRVRLGDARNRALSSSALVKHGAKGPGSKAQKGGADRAATAAAASFASARRERASPPGSMP